MYFSMIQFVQSRENFRSLRNPYSVHQSIWEAFGDGERDFLFRLETSQDKLLLYLLSKREPDFIRMKEKKNINYSFFQTKEYKPILKENDELRFYVRINPTVKREKKRVPLVHQQEIDDWINRKAGQNGFSLDAYNLKNKRNYKSYKKGNTPSITHYGVDVEGKLVIQDKNKFMEALYHGIGSAKAFGFGLLTVMRS